ncbi:MAG: hypothetical protein IPI74_05810 [Bacteroidales bacterium]|nr:hypothetical protein [Bacteroidales bacterium]
MEPVTGMQFPSQGWLSAVTGVQFPSQGWSSNHKGGTPVTRSGESIFQKPFMAVAGWRNYIVGCTDRARFILPG